MRFALGRESYVVETRGRITALLFGGEAEEAGAIPPLSGRIGETLTALFPHAPPLVRLQRRLTRAPGPPYSR